MSQPRQPFIAPGNSAPSTPFDWRDQLANLLTDDDVATLTHLVSESMGDAANNGHLESFGFKRKRLMHIFLYASMAVELDRDALARWFQARRPFFEHLVESHTVDDPRVAAVLITMEQQIEEGISIADLAATVKLSRRQLERLFLARTGMSPAIAFRRLRLNRAKHLLMSSKRPLLDVALDVGFLNTSHFCKEFKRLHGQSPAQVRNAAARQREVT